MLVHAKVDHLKQLCNVHIAINTQTSMNVSLFVFELLTRVLRSGHFGINTSKV